MRKETATREAAMKLEKTRIDGLIIVHDDKFVDERGWFMEEFNASRFAKESGTSFNPVQDNCSFSKEGVARGMHFQASSHSQAKLVKVSSGKVVDFVLDIRAESDTFMKLFSMELTPGTGLFIPKGLAHGFVALEDSIFRYKCDEYYCPESCRTIDMMDCISAEEFEKINVCPDTLIRSAQDVNGMKLSDVDFSESLPLSLYSGMT